MFILLTALKDLRRRLRDPTAFAIWIGFPLALGAMVSLAFGGLDSGEAPTAEVWVVDEDESALSGFLVTALSGGGDFGFPLIAREVSLSEGRALIEAGKGSALLIIPPNFGDDILEERLTTLQLTTNPTQFVLPQMVEESLRLLVDAVFYLQKTLGEPISRIVEATDTDDGFLENRDIAEISILINEAIIRMDSLLFPPVIELEVIRGDQSDVSDSTGQQLGLIDIFLPSLLFMALFFMALGISEDIWVEKKQGTLRRALATPNSSAHFLAGKLLSASILMAIVIFAALIAARYLLGAQIQNLIQGGIWVTLTGTVFLLLLYPLQLYASSQRGGGVLSNLIMMPLLMLGGSFFPFEMMPEGLARIGRFTPNGWALTELVSVLRDEVDWQHLAISTVILVLIGVLLFIIANRRMAGTFAQN